MADETIKPAAQMFEATSFEAHGERLERIQHGLPEQTGQLLARTLAVLAVLREAPTLHDLYRILKVVSGSLCPRSPDELSRALSERHVQGLIVQGTHPDLRHREVALAHPSLHEFLCSHRFNYTEDLLPIHGNLAALFRHLLEPYDRRHALFHAIRFYQTDIEGLTRFANELAWPLLFRGGVHQDDWAQGGNSLRGDLLELFDLLSPHARAELSSLIGGAITSLRAGRLVESIRIGELRGVVSSYSVSHVSVEPLRIMLDVWPGYFPVFAIQDKLSGHGIEIQIAQSSAQKIEHLLKRHVDLIGTTPGCLCSIDPIMLGDCHVIGALNRSSGADQILVDRRHMQRTLDGWYLADPAQLRGCQAIVTEDSTSELFFLWFLRNNGLCAADVNVIFEKDYVTTLDRARKQENIGAISTWEPWASQLRHLRPHLEIACDSRPQPGIIYDLLVCNRDRSATLDRDERLGIFWELLDECLAERLYATAGIIHQITQRYGFAIDWYERGIQMVSFFGRAERTQVFSDEGPDCLKEIFERVGQTYLESGRARERIRSASDWLSALREAGRPTPYWMKTRFSFPNSTVAAIVPSRPVIAGAPTEVTPVPRASSERAEALARRVTVGIVTALTKEFVAVEAMLDDPVDHLVERS